MVKVETEKKAKRTLSFFLGHVISALVGIPGKSFSVLQSHSENSKKKRNVYYKIFSQKRKIWQCVRKNCSVYRAFWINIGEHNIVEEAGVCYVVGGERD